MSSKLVHCSITVAQNGLPYQTFGSFDRTVVWAEGTLYVLLEKLSAEAVTNVRSRYRVSVPDDLIGVIKNLWVFDNELPA